MTTFGKQPPAESLKELIDQSLSGRERQILSYLVHGESYQQIGRHLDLSVNTIRWYAAQLLAKLGVSREDSAVARAREGGTDLQHPPLVRSPAESHMREWQRERYGGVGTSPLSS